MLDEEGWTWKDIMTSPLSPHDSQGFLIQQPILGACLQFAELKGFVFNLDSDSPSIEVLAIPADASRGRPGLFSMEDVQTVLQFEMSDLFFISLDPPNKINAFTPFSSYDTETKSYTNHHGFTHFLKLDVQETSTELQIHAGACSVSIILNSIITVVPTLYSTYTMIV